MPAAKLFGEPSRLIQMYSIANVCFCFELAKEKAETFWEFPLEVEIKIKMKLKIFLDYYLYP